MKLVDNFDLNGYAFYDTCYDPHIESNEFNIGTSELGAGLRTNVIGRCEEIEKSPSMQLLAGTLYEQQLYQAWVLKRLLYELHKKIILEKGEHLEYVKAGTTATEDRLYLDNEHYIRIHTDIRTNLYTIENKWTKVYDPQFKTKLSVKYHVQLNFHINYYKQQMGFIFVVNIGSLLNDITLKAVSRQQFWDLAWSKYGKFEPVRPMKDMYNITITRAKAFFKHVEAKNYDIECPNYVYECGFCDGKKFCKNPITTLKLETNRVEECHHCHCQLKAGDNVLQRNDNIYCKTKDENNVSPCEEACINAWRFK